MYSSAPASGAATHGPTISADSMPIANTLAKWPPCSLLVVAASIALQH